VSVWAGLSAAGEEGLGEAHDYLSSGHVPRERAGLCVTDEEDSIIL
jgi:hypothetical protein